MTSDKPFGILLHAHAVTVKERNLCCPDAVVLTHLYVAYAYSYKQTGTAAAVGKPAAAAAAAAAGAQSDRNCLIYSLLRYERSHALGNPVSVSQNTLLLVPLHTHLQEAHVVGEELIHDHS